MAELKYKPVPHKHEEFLAKARARKGFAEAYDSLGLEYEVPVPAPASQVEYTR